MSRTTVYLIRHGDVEPQFSPDRRRVLYGPEAVLSDTGRAKAQQLAEKMTGIGPMAAIYTSPYPRASETARIIAQAFGINMITDDRLHDTLVPKLWGVRLDEVLKRGPNSFWDSPTEGQETPAQIDARMFATFNEIIKAYEGKSLAIVSHGDPIKILYYRLYHRKGALPPMQDLKKCELGNAESCRLVLDAESSVKEEEFLFQRDGTILNEHCFLKSND